MGSFEPDLMSVTSPDARVGQAILLFNNISEESPQGQPSH
jgi:hypothetical protein